MAFLWRTMMALLIPSSTKISCQSWTPSEKMFWIRAWILSLIIFTGDFTDNTKSKGDQTFFVLNSFEREIATAHKAKLLIKYRIFLLPNSQMLYFFMPITYRIGGNRNAQNNRQTRIKNRWKQCFRSPFVPLRVPNSY